MYGADFTMPGMLVGRILRSPHAHARIRSIDTSKAEALPGVKAVMTCEGPPRPEVRLRRPGARRGEFLAHDAQHHGAREGALRGPRRRRRRRDQRGHRRGGAGADRGRLRGAAARHRRRRGDEAGRAAAVRGHDHARRRAAADQALEHLEAHRIQDRRHRGRLRAGRRGRREGVQDRGGAPGLYRAACLRRALRRRRPEPSSGASSQGHFVVRALYRQAPRHEDRRPARLSGRDRRRLRRQDGGLPRAGRRRSCRGSPAIR